MLPVLSVHLGLAVLSIILLLDQEILPGRPVRPVRPAGPHKSRVDALNLRDGPDDLDVCAVGLGVPLLDVRFLAVFVVWSDEKMWEPLLHDLQSRGGDAVHAVVVTQLEELRWLRGAQLLLHGFGVLADREEEQVVVHEGGLAVVGAAGLCAVVQTRQGGDGAHAACSVI